MASIFFLKEIKAQTTLNEESIIERTKTYLKYSGGNKIPRGFQSFKKLPSKTIQCFVVFVHWPYAVLRSIKHVMLLLIVLLAQI